MATLSIVNPTLRDVTSRMDPDGNIDSIVELLSETNEVLSDMTFMEGNLPTGHRTTIRSGLPAPTWRKLYGGVQPNKSTTVQVTEACGMMEAYAEVDKALADLNGNTSSFRTSEDRAHIEGMNQEFASTLFYGDVDTAPEEFEGFAQRFSSTTAENGGNVVLSDGSASGADQTSIWLVVWGPNTCHGIYPKGSTAGLQMTDKGQVTIEDIDGSGGRMEAYRTHYRWDVGMTVRDWRYIARVANVDTGRLTADESAGAKIAESMITAMHKVPNINFGRPVFYCNRTVLTYLDLQTWNKSSMHLTYRELPHGERVLDFRGVPVRRCDAILNTEAVVS